MKVPGYDNFQVAPNVKPMVPANDGGAMQTASLVGKPEQEVGKGLQDIGGAVSQIATDMQEQANQVRLNSAKNDYIGLKLKKTFDPQEGYLARKGQTALDPDADGQSLPDSYHQQMKDASSQIADRLGNDAQRRAFSLFVNDDLTQFRGDIEKHMLTEYRSFALSTQDGTIKLGVDTAKLNWNNPDKIPPAIDSVRAAVYEAGRISGDAPALTEAKMKVQVSGVHMGVIEAMLENNNPEYALTYLNNKKGEMTADDLLKTRSVINKDVYARLADGTATNVVDSLRTKIRPTDSDRILNITMQTESNGNPNAVGPYVPGQGTAKGSMQVMDATNLDPGYGVTPAKDDSKEERARVGRDYMLAMVKEYAGDTSKAWAAYNAGPRTVNDAIKSATDGNWLALLPKETQDYVAKNQKALDAGGGTGERPTLQSVHDGIRAKLGPNPQPQVLKMALEAGTKQWEDLNKALTTQGDNAVSQAQQWLISNNGDFAKLPNSLRMAVTSYAPGKMDDLIKFSKAISKGENETNMAAYNAAVTYPEELAKMTDAQFLQFQKTHFSLADQEKVAKIRANELNGKTDESTGAINNRALNTVLENRLESIGINPKPKRDDLPAMTRIGTIQKFARDSIYSAQQQKGTKLTPQEIEQHVDQLFTKSVQFRNTFLGIGLGTDSQTLMTMKIGDIPSDTRDAIKQSFIARGVANPTDDQIIRTYWTKKNAK